MLDPLLNTILKPYVPDCRYLKAVTFEPPALPGDLPSATGWFEIPNAFYIQNTGHFNAVEFILCFNQLGYMLTSHCLLTGAFPKVGVWSLERFKENQLPNVLIVDVQSTFKKPIDGHGFQAKLSIPWVSAQSRHLFYDMRIEFSDANGGCATGTVRVCLKNCLEQARPATLAAANTIMSSNLRGAESWAA